MGTGAYIMTPPVCSSRAVGMPACSSLRRNSTASFNNCCEIFTGSLNTRLNVPASSGSNGRPHSGHVCEANPSSGYRQLKQAAVQAFIINDYMDCCGAGRRAAWKLLVVKWWGAADGMRCNSIYWRYVFDRTSMVGMSGRRRPAHATGKKQAIEPFIHTFDHGKAQTVISRTIHLRRPVVLQVEDQPFVPNCNAEQLAEIERRWEARRSANPALHDGRLTHVLGVHRN